MNWKDWPVDEFAKRSDFGWNKTGCFHPNHPTDPSYHANKCLVEYVTNRNDLVTALEFQDIESGDTIYTSYNSWEMTKPLYNFEFHDTLGELSDDLMKTFGFSLVEKCVVDAIQPRESRGKSKLEGEEKMTTKYRVFTEDARLISTKTGEKRQFKFKYLWKSLR